MSTTNKTPLIRMGLLLLLIGFGGFLYWAMYIPLAKGVVAMGSVSVDGKRKTIQHLEGGIIAAIHVQDGDTVEANQQLIELESTRARAERDLLKVRLQHTRALMERLKAERNQRGSVTFIEENEAARLQTSLFQARLQQINGQRNLLKQRIKQLQRKIAGLESQRVAFKQQKKLVMEELERSQKLHQKKLVELPLILKLQKEQSQIIGEIGRIDAEVAATRVAIGEAELEVLQLDNNRQQEVAEEILQAQEKLLELREQLAAAEDILRRTRIHAPRNGVVLDLNAHTIGGVIAPGSPILDLVPESARLIVEARVQPTDIDNIYTGMAARIRLSAFKQRTTPTLNGEVEFVSADALTDEALQQTYYLARIVIPQSEKEQLGALEVLPGMPAEVLIEAGSRTAMEYLLDPIEDVVRRGMKEQ